MESTAVAAQNSAEWESLPYVLTELIAEHLALKVLCHYVVADAKSRKTILRKRLVNRAFATALRHAWKLFPPRTILSTWSLNPRELVPAHALPTFVEGLLRLVALFASRGERFSTDTYSSLYTEIITSCCQKCPNNQAASLYSELGAQTSALIQSGALRDLTAERRLLFARTVGCLFRYLDRFYVPRLNLTEVEPYVLSKFGAVGNNAPDNKVASQNAA